MQLAHRKWRPAWTSTRTSDPHPIRRLRRTILIDVAIVFGDRDTALAAARTSTRFMPASRAAYRALDPDLLLWVHRR